MDKKLRREALAALDKAEQSLRKLIARAALERQFEEVAWIVDLARQVIEVRDRNAGDDGHSGAVETLLPIRSKPALEDAGEQSSHLSSLGETSPYPRFSVHGGRLVKTGWSKKNKSEYEHRAPKSAIQTVFDAIGESGSRGTFDVDTVTPMNTLGLATIPNYQVYMAIGWLRVIGYVEKCGRNQYRISGSSDAAFETLWNQLPRN